MNHVSAKHIASRPLAAKAYAVVGKIRYQAPETPEAKFFFAIFEKAVLDSVPTNDQTPSISVNSARHYLCGEMPHLAHLGIDNDWVRKVLRDSGLMSWAKPILTTERK